MRSHCRRSLVLHGLTWFICWNMAVPAGWAAGEQVAPPNPIDGSGGQVLGGEGITVGPPDKSPPPTPLDSDRDGYYDRTERWYHTNPNNPASYPAVHAATANQKAYEALYGKGALATPGRTTAGTLKPSSQAAQATPSATPRLPPSASGGQSIGGEGITGGGYRPPGPQPSPQTAPAVPEPPAQPVTQGEQVAEPSPIDGSQGLSVEGEGITVGPKEKSPTPTPEDTDHDGYYDRTEKYYGTDPKNAANYPADSPATANKKSYDALYGSQPAPVPSGTTPPAVQAAPSVPTPTLRPVAPGEQVALPSPIDASGGLSTGGSGLGQAGSSPLRRAPNPPTIRPVPGLGAGPNPGTIGLGVGAAVVGVIAIGTALGGAGGAGGGGGGGDGCDINPCGGGAAAVQVHESCGDCPPGTHYIGRSGPYLNCVCN